MATVSQFRAAATDLGRRGVPDPLVPALVRARARRMLQDPAVLHDARLQMEFLLGRTRPGADIDAAARRHVELILWKAETRWHPRLLRTPVRGVERVQALMDSPRGLVFSCMHHGIGGGDSLPRAGIHADLVVHTNAHDPAAPRYMKRFYRVHTVRQRTISIDEGSPMIRQRLADGAAVMLALDVPGHTPVTFAEHRVLGSSGAARLAYEMDVPVSPFTTLRDDGGRPFMQVGEPVEPRDFPSVEALLAALVRHHEAAVLAWPEAVEWPSRRWTLLEAEDQQRFVPAGREWRI